MVKNPANLTTSAMKVEAVRRELHELLGRYPTARKVFARFEGDKDVEEFQRLANNFMVGRLGYNDHGRTHAYIVARNALRLLDVIRQNGIVPNLVKEELGSYDDVATVVTVAGFLHDIGNSVHRLQHGIHSMVLALPILEKHLHDHTKKNTLISFILEAIYAHNEGPAITVEASIVKVADGMDMEEGRARIPYKLGKFDIHSVSALSIKKVGVEKGMERPIRIIVEMEHTAGLFQVEKVLGEKIRESALSGNVEVLLKIPSIGEKVLYF